MKASDFIVEYLIEKSGIRRDRFITGNEIESVKLALVKDILN